MAMTHQCVPLVQPLNKKIRSRTNHTIIHGQEKRPQAIAAPFMAKEKTAANLRKFSENEKACKPIRTHLRFKKNRKNAANYHTAQSTAVILSDLMHWLYAWQCGAAVSRWTNQRIVITEAKISTSRKQFIIYIC